MAKLMRLKMSAQLGDLLRGLPVSVRESTKTDCVYLGRGFLTAGAERPDVTVRVFLKKGKPMASLESKMARIELVSPFDTEEERSSFPEKAVKAITSSMN
jgi:hypothetical protein